MQDNVTTEAKWQHFWHMLGQTANGIIIEECTKCKIRRAGKIYSFLGKEIMLEDPGCSFNHKEEPA